MIEIKEAAYDAEIEIKNQIQSLTKLGFDSAYVLLDSKTYLLLRLSNMFLADKLFNLPLIVEPNIEKKIKVLPNPQASSLYFESPTPQSE